MDILGIFSKIHVEFARTNSPSQPHNNHVAVVIKVLECYKRYLKKYSFDLEDLHNEFGSSCRFQKCNNI